MRENIRAFVKEGIPLMDTAGLHKPLSENPIGNRHLPLLFLYALLLAAATAFLLFGLISVMNRIPTYSGLPGVSRDLDERDWLLLSAPVVIALLTRGILYYAGDGTKRMLRPFQGILLINSGIPLGLEGPLADMPFAIAAHEKRSRQKKRILAAACMTSGLAFLFGAPLTAVALAIELLVIELSWIGIVAIVLGGGTGLLCRYCLIGTDPVFLTPDIPAASFPMLLVYTGTGILVGLLGMLTRRMTNGAKKLFKCLPFDQLWWPVVVAIIVGITGYFKPELAGGGYEHIDSLLLGRITLQFLVVMMIGKLLLLSICIGGGIPGSAMTPLVIAGGAAGLFITFLLQFAFPALHLNFTVAALVGMSAMFAAGNRVLIAPILFAIETTHALHALLPVICACTAAYAMVFLLSKKKDSRAYDILGS
ncbi:chloride channel protein [Chitinophaga pinensis]|uniref:Chloride channel core n=1 Tax=Chitinophaga pinensis (strain ATCC 43595 / DSM 2588 / LMG 13176 / NBRC 15968 / NCIMB 11800 / UQM 2034) TaxID=485918 RepID=A0A979GQV2_CHIPD|nr:chloride channel protein [Chitinophaga pinensis]ACU58011.1 Chloride channel core [Chitinophaga pinensis DSM 2588]